MLRLPRLCIAALVTLWLPAAMAGPPIRWIQVMESATARALFETQAGAEVLDLFGHSAKTYPQFIEKISAPEFAGVRNDLVIHVAEIDDTVRALRKSQGTPASAELSAAERMLLTQVAPQIFRVQPHWTAAAELGSSEIAFLREEIGGARSVREALLKPGPTSPALREPARPATAAELARAEGEVKGFFGKMHSCLNNRPEHEAKSFRRRNLLINTATAELFTIQGFITGAGSEEVNWDNLPNDVFTTALHSYISNKIVFSGKKVHIRWIRMSGYSVLMRAPVEGIIYSINPVKDTRGLSDAEAGLERYEYNAAWNIATSFNPIALGMVYEGLECLYGAKAIPVNLGIRISNSMIMSHFYYKGRNSFEDWNREGLPLSTRP